MMQTQIVEATGYPADLVLRICRGADVSRRSRPLALQQRPDLLDPATRRGDQSARANAMLLRS
jgi:hypothetical protein